MGGVVPGRIVHYVAPGSADGRYPPAHRAAVITEVPWAGLGGGPDSSRAEGVVNLCVFNPTGVHFVQAVPYDAEGATPYSWHWIERCEPAGARETSHAR